MQFIIIGIVLLLMSGCVAQRSGEHKRLVGDHTGTQYEEVSPGVVQNLKTGRTGFRQGAWIIDGQTGKQTFVYGNQVEEK